MSYLKIKYLELKIKYFEVLKKSIIKFRNSDAPESRIVSWKIKQIIGINTMQFREAKSGKA